MIKKLLSLWRNPQADTKSDLYNAGQDYMIKLLEKYPEKLAVDQAWKVTRDYDNPFDKGVIDYWNEYQALQRGQFNGSE